VTDLPWPSPDASPTGSSGTTPGADAAVRHARLEDVAAMARVQADAWRAAYRGLVPDDALAGLGGPDAVAAWAEAVAAQAPRRHVLVATAGSDIVGFTTLTTAGDPDLDPAVDAELAVLVIDPARTRQGHASRLLAAVADLAREDGFTHLFTWAPSSDDPLRRLLVESGWAADGARRTLGDGDSDSADGGGGIGSGGTEAHQLRLLTAL
jgi:GNAT superfamily N-acetyltransferase